MNTPKLPKLVLALLCNLDFNNTIVTKYLYLFAIGSPDSICMTTGWQFGLWLSLCDKLHSLNCPFKDKTSLHKLSLQNPRKNKVLAHVCESNLWPYLMALPADHESESLDAAQLSAVSILLAHTYSHILLSDFIYWYPIYYFSPSISKCS